MRYQAVLAITVVILLLPPASNSHATTPGTLDVALAIDFSEGKYGETSKTRIHYLPLTLDYKTFPWQYRITVPYIHISGPGVVIGGADGGIVTGAESNSSISEQGIGDIILSTTYALDTVLSTPPYFDITTKLKLPTGDKDKYLGTGETDLSLQVDIANNYASLTPFATLGYKIVGEPESINYNNSLFFSLGTSWKISDIYTAGMIFDFRQSVVDSVEDPKEGIIYLNWKPDRNLSIMVYAVSGFSTASPDSGLGLRIKYSQ